MGCWGRNLNHMQALPAILSLQSQLHIYSFSRASPWALANVFVFVYKPIRMWHHGIKDLELIIWAAGQTDLS